VREAAEWLEYITSASQSALAQERRANGRDAPWKIDYLTFGNETWDCGGNMRAQYYGDLYSQFATFAKTAGDQPYRVLSGSHDGNPQYTGELLAHPETAALAEGVSLHFYTLPTGDWGKKGAALGFPEAQWASAIHRTLRMDAIIERQLAEMDARTGDKKLGLLVDEWGVWVDTEEGDPALHQQNTIRDAVVAGLNLNIFHAHADRVPMANIAQMVNVLQAMILTDGPRMLLTPTYHVFMMYKPFQGATALPVSVAGPEYRLGEVAFPALSASAALTPGGELVVAVVNADARDAHPVSFAVGSRSLAGAQVLRGASLDAHNSFDRPDVIKPADAAVPVRGSVARYEMPARSVLVARFK
jgi:alpha-N-arabinofuranosidase